MSLRKAFEKWSRTVCFQAPPDAATEYAFEAYQEGYKAALNEPDDGWISVDERLPDRYDTVIVFAATKPEIGKVTRKVVDVSQYDSDGFEMMQKCSEYQIYEDTHFADIDYIVTHWMPLPSAPKEKS